MSNAQFVIVVESNGTVYGHDFVSPENVDALLDSTVPSSGRDSFTLGDAEWFYTPTSTGDHNDTAAQGAMRIDPGFYTLPNLAGTVVIVTNDEDEFNELNTELGELGSLLAM